MSHKPDGKVLPGPGITRRSSLVALVALGGLCMPGAAALAQADTAAKFPADRPISVVYPYPPGGSGDLLMRMLTQRMAEALGGTVLIDFAPGGNTVVGASKLSRAKPDGHTLMVAAGGTFVFNPFLYDKPPYDPEKEFDMVAVISHTPLLAVVAANSKFQTLADAVTSARAKPGTLTVGVIGVANTTRLVSELLWKKAGVQVVTVPYPGSAAAQGDILTGRVDMLFDASGVVLQQIHAGKLRALAVSTKNRIPQLPDVPTMASTYPEVVGTGWFAMAAPKGTPTAVKTRIREVVNGFLQSREPGEQMVKLGQALAAPQTQADVDEFMASERATWGPLIKALGLKI